MHPREAAQHRARGASELPAAVDCEFRVEPYEEEGVWLVRSSQMPKAKTLRSQNL